jgi:hypothetical protein
MHPSAAALFWCMVVAVQRIHWWHAGQQKLWWALVCLCIMCGLCHQHFLQAYLKATGSHHLFSPDLPGMRELLLHSDTPTALHQATILLLWV